MPTQSRIGRHGHSLRIAGLIGLFVATIVGILVHTMLTFQSQKLDALVIDLAGRQRMLHQRHMKEVLLVSQGFVADPGDTRRTLRETLDALITGGPAVMTLGEDQTVDLPAAPTDRLREKLLQQKTLMQEFAQEADAFLDASLDGAAYISKVEELRGLNARLYDVSNEAVRLFDQHSESKFHRTILRDLAVLFLVGLIGALLARQVVRSNRQLGAEITERKRAVSEMQRTQTLLSSIVENLPDMIFVKDAKNLKFVRFNRAGEELLGYGRDELIGKNDYDFFPLKEADFFCEKDREVLAGGRLVDIEEEPIQTRLKGRRYLHTKKVPIIGEDGAPEYLLGISEDITERKRAGEQLEIMQFAIDHSSVAVYWVRPDGHFFHVNKAACRALGYTPAELLSMSVFDIDPNYPANAWSAAWEELKREHTLSYESQHQRKDGTVFPVEITANYLEYLGMEYGCAFAVDITGRKLAEEELRKSKEQTIAALRHSDALKTALLSSVSHELRTPLTAIKAMVSSLRGPQGTMKREVRAEFLEGIDQEIDFLNRLVDNLLDMSRIEAGTLEPRREWHLLEDLVEGAIRREGKALQSRPLEVELPEDLPSVYVNGVEVQQVLINLLDNAVKYSPPGCKIRLEAEARSGEVEVRVSNGGEGIPAEDLERVFDRFYRVRSGRERMQPGTGLGLAICKGMVEAHGGRIWAESSPGQETTVAFRLPLSADSLPASRLEPLSKQEDGG